MTPRFLLCAAALLCACSSDPTTPADVPDASTAKDSSSPVDTAVDALDKCASDEIACGDKCVQSSSDPSNCGGCGNACGADETCTGGSCACVTGKTKCGAACVDTSSDVANCGTCGKACVDKEVCSAGTCYAPCPTGQSRCGAVCVNTNADVKNCGACGTTCAAGQACNSGSCGIACEYPTKACSGTCINVGFDAENCGDCGKKCPTGVNGTAGCTSSSCVLTCTTGWGNCDDKAETGCEVNLNSTDANCGVCGKICSSTETCLSGKCECKTGNLRCSGVCVDVTSDSANCGACAKVCATTETCSSSSCTCKTGLTRCPSVGGTCSDTKTDAKNCGACGTVCPGTGICSEGMCCPLGQINCGGTCVDPKADPNNCGACGTKCDTASPYCAAGICGTGCGGLTACGYTCTDLAKDVKNCGACGTACLATETCLSSTCAQLGFPGSDLVDNAQGAKINGWIGTPGQLWKRCYSKALNGGTGATFHSLCDGKGSSVTLLKLTSGTNTRLVGAYLTPSWSTAGYIADTTKTSFLFSLTNDVKHPYFNTSTLYAAYGASTYGPTFGGGFDLYIPSALTGGYCYYLGSYYQCRTGTSKYSTCAVDFCGTSSSLTTAFVVNGLEVWVK